MPYDRSFAQRDTYALTTALAFGAGSGTATLWNVISPKGLWGYVRDIIVDITATMVGTTTVPEITVGSAASTTGSIKAEYGRFRLGSAIGTGYTTGVKRASALAAGAPGVTGGVPPALTDFAGHIQLETAQIPADTAIVITAVEGVGGTPAGTARVMVQIDWF